MNWLINNWYLIIGGIALLAFVVYCVYTFCKMPSDKQTAKVKQWLIWACIEAEKALQSGTGQAKLLRVYEMFCLIPAFTWVSKIISFELFSKWVKEALVKAKEMLVENGDLANYVYGNNAKIEVKKIQEQLKDNKG